jgi:two-component sensor histidine kinase
MAHHAKLDSFAGEKRSPTPHSAQAAFEKKVQAHCEKVLGSYDCKQLVVQFDQLIHGICPASLEVMVLQVIVELLSNSLEHGFYSRQRGRIFVYIYCRTEGVQISVADDGWGFDGAPVDRTGFQLLRQFGRLSFRAQGGPFIPKAAVTVEIPAYAGDRLSGSSPRI